MGSNAGGFQTEREREKKVEETMLTGGSRPTVREREEVGAGLASFPGWFGPRVRPSWDVPSLFLFFVLISFSFVF
jgi:hypothetical protein